MPFCANLLVDVSGMIYVLVPPQCSYPFYSNIFLWCFARRSVIFWFAYIIGVRKRKGKKEREKYKQKSTDRDTEMLLTTDRDKNIEVSIFRRTHILPSDTEFKGKVPASSSGAEKGFPGPSTTYHPYPLTTPRSPFGQLK